MTAATPQALAQALAWHIGVRSPHQIDPEVDAGRHDIHTVRVSEGNHAWRASTLWVFPIDDGPHGLAVQLFSHDGIEGLHVRFPDGLNLTRDFDRVLEIVSGVLQTSEVSA